jgi:hypothetical protein
MFAAIEIDWQSIFGSAKPILIAILGLMAATSFGGPALGKLWVWLKSRLSTAANPANAIPVGERSSDQPAPDGTTDYLAAIKSSSPQASDATRWLYAVAGKTEAQVAKSEATLAVHPVIA